MFSPRRHLPTSPILQPPDLFQSPPAAARPVHPSSRHPARKKPHPHALLSGASSYLRWRLPILLRRRLRQLDTAGVRPRRRQAALLLASSAPSPSIHASVILHQELCRVFRGYTVLKQRSAPSNIFRPPPRQVVNRRMLMLKLAMQPSKVALNKVCSFTKSLSRLEDSEKECIARARSNYR
ncbi:uncharacterized protein LOC125508471 isoform X1 [Triticum urartu]|uniref:uncharacterized protein LOC125508471 isoform X1 n=1 Tax=Triticum urartu TaxID=4572 RepID=UPI002042D7E8|nr:uncharacterized protein LOC125508471 isoform X1 [Triticum urartu]